MAKKLQLSIQEPCHENWDSMSSIDRGKFCGSCRKRVIDFSTMSDRQIAEFFRKPSNGSVCGRFMTDQLDREIEIPRKRIPWLKYFFSILLPAFFISKADAQKLMGKPSFTERDTTRIPLDHEFRTLGMVLPTNITPVCTDSSIKGEIQVTKVKQVKVNGRIVDEQGNAVPNATVTIAQNGKILNANADGRFTFISASDHLIELVCTSVGFQPSSYVYPFTLQYSSQVDITIELKKAIVGLPEVVLPSVCFATSKRYAVGGVSVIADTVTRNADTLKQIIKDPLNDIQVRFYPNPIRSGQTLSIEIQKPEEGFYRWQMVDIQGKLVQEKELWIDTEARLLELQIPFVSSGTYIMVLVNKKTGKRYSGKIIVD